MSGNRLNQFCLMNNEPEYVADYRSGSSVPEVRVQKKLLKHVFQQLFTGKKLL